ncbi:MAG: (d)CMP kinase [Bacteroidetes bacterium]|nr:MAG: (d)CMP kinase [Bacteroidota bacterium]
MSVSITIAIDGHSSTGKSTLAKRLASSLSYLYVDTGAMYRCATLCALNAQLLTDLNHLDSDAIAEAVRNCEIGFVRGENGSNRATLNGVDVEDEIRTMGVSSKVSYVSAIPAVRANLVEQQQKMGQAGGVVMDGRDIGTVVFPNAELKIFMTARSEVRAQRRYEELLAKGEEVSFAEVAENLQERDVIDSNREVGPLVAADDARLLDNSDITLDEQFKIALSWAQIEIEKRGEE